MIGFISLMVGGGIITPQAISADSNNATVKLAPATLIHNGHLTICKINKSSYHVVKTIKMLITAYSSTPDQTDDTPFITASGKHVARQIIATNGLPFNTKVRIPELYGDEVFIVGDRMHQRMGNYRADLWFPTRDEARAFGAKYDVKMEVLES